MRAFLLCHWMIGALGLLMFAGVAAQAQTTTPSGIQLVEEPTPMSAAEGDSRFQTRWGSPYSPRTAAMLSAALPGLGQIYNRSYWKLPIIYGLFATGAGISIYYNQQYADFRGHLFAAIDNDPNTINDSGYSVEVLRNATNFYRRQRDFTYIITGFVYLLNVAEAHIDAHLKEFDLTDDLALRYAPTVQPTFGGGPAVGVGLSLQIGR